MHRRTESFLRLLAVWIERSLTYALDVANLPMAKLILLVPVPDFEDQSLAIAIEAKKRGIPIAILTTSKVLPASWIKHGLSPRLVKRNSFLDIYYSKRARFIIFTAGYFWSAHPRKQQVVLNVWHGTPLKKVGIEIERPVPGSTDVVVAGNSALPLVKRMYQADEFPTIHMTGLPRNDFLIGHDRWTGESIKRVLWMPTYRIGYMDYLASTRTIDETTSGIDNTLPMSEQLFSDYADQGKFQIDGAQTQNGLGLTTSELIHMDTLLQKSNVVFDLKPHPLAFIDLPDSLTNINFLKYSSDSESLYESFKSYDGFMTDYSSVSLDWALLGRPIFLFCPDFNDYADTRGFFIRPHEALEIPLLTSVETLLNAINHPAEFVPKQNIINEWNSNVEGNASAKILELLESR